MRKKGANTEKAVSFRMMNRAQDGGVTESRRPAETMTREQFLERCGEFFDARGTRFNDFEFLTVRINPIGKED